MSNKQHEIKDVQPIRSLERIEDMKWSLKRWCGERLAFDSDFGSLEEQITFSLIEYIRKKYRESARRINL